MRAFAEDFFRQFGAMVQPHEQFANEVVVDLPTELVEAFGKPRLYLVFPEAGSEPPDLSPNEDLVVYGSRTFEQMVTLLQRRGEAVQLRLPSQISLDPAGDYPFPLPLDNCELWRETVRLVNEQFFVFNYRAIFASDERQEDFITVVLDQTGQPRPEMTPSLTSLSFQNYDPQPVTVKETTLQQVLATAGEVAQEQLQTRIAELEAQSRLRLQQALLRLTTYYRRLTEEINPADPTQADQIRADLQQDLSRKVADELERHHLHVTLRPLSYALIEVPLVYHQAVLISPAVALPVSIPYNLHTLKIEGFSCHHCHEPLDRVALCAHGHPVHPHCFERCTQCDRAMCQTCGIHPDVLSNNLICVDCAASCTHCDRWLNRTVIATCAICDRPYCPDHSLVCRRCRQTYCQVCGTEGVCHTCQAVIEGGDVAQATTVVPELTGLKPNRYQWRQAQNQHYTIFWGQHKWLPKWSQAIIVVKREQEVVHWRIFSLWQRWFGPERT